MDVLTMTPLVLLVIVIWHIAKAARAVRRYRREEDRRYLRGGPKPWWGDQ